MKRIASIVIASLSVALSAVPQAGADPVPIDVWARRDAVSSLSVSPDGKHLLMLSVSGKHGKGLLKIYDVNNLAKPIRRLNANPMEIISASWIDDNHIFGTAWKVVRKSVKRPGEDVRSYKTFSYNLKKNKFSEVSGNFQIISLLPKEPDKILIARGNAVTGGYGVDPFAAFRPRSYYKFDTNTGAKTLVIKGNTTYNQLRFDIDGNPRFAQGFDAASHKQLFYYRAVGDKRWKRYKEALDLDLPENLYKGVLGGFQGFQGVSAEDPNIGYVIDYRNGEDKAGLYTFDFKTGEIGKKLYSNPDAEVLGIQTSSMSRAGDNRLVAALYPGAKMERHWFDAREKALYDQLEGNIPYAHQVNISSRSRDGKVMTVTNRGPKDPGSYWLVKDGRLIQLASKNPLLKPKDLSETRFIHYKARDGLDIPAYLTVPNTGKAPYPLIVLPHGGPHVNEVVTYDEWTQFLANNGYMVLQPQYRMSVGWGKKHFEAGYNQHGLAMQDDLDDGAMYLVKQGLADPDRIAMYGWSYGGYAALVAVSRTPQIYQCAIAGAAVADAKKAYLRQGGGTSIKALNDWARARGGFVGINPINEVEKINIPLLMIHGDVDQRVEYFNYKDYREAVIKLAEKRRSSEAGKCSGGLTDTVCVTTVTRKPATKGDSEMSISGINENPAIKVKFVTLKGADHFYATLMYEHQAKLYSEILDFLKNDCGPGGL